MAHTVSFVLARRRRIHLALAAVAAVFVIVTIPGPYSVSDDTDSSHFSFKGSDSLHREVPSPTARPRPALALPVEYDDVLEHAVPQSEYCTERFTPRYLDGFRTHAIQYCATGSAVLQCFQSHSRPKNEIDSICIGQGATLDVDRRKFSLDCELRNPDANETDRGLIPFHSIRGEWYQSGPRVIFDRFVHVGRAPGAPSTQSPSKPRFALLVKRECDANIWHCLMEIMTMTMTFDLLRTTPDPSRSGGPFFADHEDAPSTEVIVLDDLSDGPLLDLWTMVTGRPPIRLKDILDDPDKARDFAEVPRSIIVPLAGAANPIWQNDWTDHDCGHAPLLKAFYHRVLRFYGIATTDNNNNRKANPAAADRDSSQPPPITLTFINRTGSRKLIDYESLLAAVAARHPHVRIQSVDFATISFVEQLKLVRETDVLLGVHGAGLTHTMFMREPEEGHSHRGAAVVEIRPRTNDYRGFRNMAFMKGLRYFTTFGEQVPVMGEGHDRGLAKEDDWHWDDVRIGEEEFMRLMDEAIAAVSH